MLKRVSRIMVFLFLFWLLVSVVFYSQHQRFVWSTEIPGWKNLQHQGVQIKKVFFYNWEKKELSFEEIKKKNLVIQAVAQKLPKKWRLSFFQTASKIMQFYSFPYKELDGWRVELVGVAKENIIGEEAILGHINSPLIYVNDQKVQIGTRLVGDANSNGLIFFKIEAKENQPEFSISDTQDIQVEFNKYDGTMNKQKYNVNNLKKELMTPFQQAKELPNSVSEI